MNTLYEKRDLAIAQGLYKNEQEKCERFARSIHKLRESRKQYDDKREKSKIIFLENTPEKCLNTKKFSNICQAVTLKGKKCTFKASCGNFCKKHTPKK